MLFESSTGYKVGLFRVKEIGLEEYKPYLNKTITFTGNFMPLNNELTYMFIGSFVNHPRFGIQFNVTSYESVTPSTLDGIVSYLSSDLFKGIGVKTAKNIVDTFTGDTINIIKSGSPLLSKVKGMNEKKARELTRKMLEYDKDQTLIVAFNKLGFTTEECLKIINKYKDRSFEIIENNIYLLNEDINFLKLDKVFLSLHEETDKLRLNALTKYCIKNLCYSTGNTLVDKESLYLEMSKFFDNTITTSLFLNTLDELIDMGDIVEVDTLITLNNFYETEENIADYIMSIDKTSDLLDKEQILKYIEKYEKENSIIFNEEQKNAISGALINNFFIISGGPGTGKTTIIKAIVDIYEKMNPRVTVNDITLLAPTGRAAKRITESVGRKSSTIHKFLKWNKETKEFNVNRFNPSDTKLIIVDEASMVDIFLFNSLIDALMPNVKIILVGDANQLPSIAPGNLLKDLLSSNDIPKIYLKEIYRTKSDSYIIPLANLIKDQVEFTEVPESHEDFRFINTNDMQIKSYLTSICEKAKEKDIDIDNFQVLIPMYKGENGIDNINKIMQDIFNPETLGKTEIILNNTLYREGDKVLQLVNDVDNNIYNGDVGYIKRIVNGKTPLVQITYNTNTVTYTKGKFDEFTLSYAVSVHKSQGSEYDNVVIVIPSNMKRMLYNKLVYTAVTRAKKSLIIIGSIDSLNYSIKEIQGSNRLTSLKTFFSIK